MVGHSSSKLSSTILTFPARLVEDDLYLSRTALIAESLSNYVFYSILPVLLAYLYTSNRNVCGAIYFYLSMTDMIRRSDNKCTVMKKT